MKQYLRRDTMTGATGRPTDTSPAAEQCFTAFSWYQDHAACWERHMCVNNLLKVVNLGDSKMSASGTCDLIIA